MDAGLLEQEMKEILKLIGELEELLKGLQKKRKADWRISSSLLGVTPSGHVYPLFGSHHCEAMDCPAMIPEPVTKE